MQIFKSNPQLPLLTKKLPLYGWRVPAGFPSPADDFIEKTLDLNQHLISHPEATFFVKVSGDSMIDAGIKEGDILIVDKSLEPSSGKIVIAVIDGEFTVKRWIKKGKQYFLQPENPNFPTIELSTSSDIQIWGVVTAVIHSL